MKQSIKDIWVMDSPGYARGEANQRIFYVIKEKSRWVLTAMNSKTKEWSEQTTPSKKTGILQGKLFLVGKLNHSQD